MPPRCRPRANYGDTLRVVTAGTPPDFENMSTVPIPDDGVVRAVAENARDIDVADERVTVNTQGLVPPLPTLHTLLFNPDPSRPMQIDGTIRFTLAEPLDVEGRECDGFMWVDIETDADTHRVESVELAAGCW